MKKSGYVESVYGNNAVVRIKRDSACGDNCGNCSGCNLAVSVDALNYINAKQGDKVEVEMNSKTVIGTAFMVYIIPLVVLIIGYIIGDYIFNNELKSIFTSLIFFSLCVIMLIAYSRFSKKEIQNKIVCIIN